jgi:nitrogen regulatory protein PII
MKRIEAIIRPEKMETLLAALSEAGYPGVMVFEIKGNGRQKGVPGGDAESWVNLLPKTKLDVVVADDQLDHLLETIQKTARSGNIGDGKIFVSDIQNAIRIRTGEVGESALI